MMDAGHVRAEGVEPRPNRVRQAVLGAEQDHVARRTRRGVIRHGTSRRQARGEIEGDPALAQAGIADEQRELAGREPTGP